MNNFNGANSSSFSFTALLPSYFYWYLVSQCYLVSHQVSDSSYLLKLAEKCPEQKYLNKTKTTQVTT